MFQEEAERGRPSGKYNLHAAHLVREVTTTMTHRTHHKCRIAALAFVVCCYGASLNAQAPNDAADVTRLVEILNLHEGSSRLPSPGSSFSFPTGARCDR